MTAQAPDGGRETPGQESGPFYERPFFKGAAAVIGILGATWALTGAPKPWDVATEITVTEAPVSNTAIVLDGSAAMSKGFGSADQSKLDAAVKAVDEYVAPFSEEGLALLRSGGPLESDGSCEDNGEVLVDFGADHQDEIRDAAATVNPEGRANLGNAVLAALDQFADTSGSARRQRVVVFTGGGDQCLGDQAARRIRRELARTGIETVFNLVALKVSKGERKQLRKFTKTLGHRAVVEFVETEKELGKAVANTQDEALEAGGGAQTLTAEGEEAKASAEEGSEEGEGEGEEEEEKGEGGAEGEAEGEVDEPEGEVVEPEGEVVEPETEPESSEEGEVVEGGVGESESTEAPAGVVRPSPLG